MTRKPHRLSIFSQPLDRAALLAYFLGGIVPLIGLVVVARRYAGAALLEPGLGIMVLSLALLSLGSFFLLRKTTRLALQRAERDNRRLVSLVDSSRALAQTADAEEVTEVATRCAAALTQARAAYFLTVGREGATFTVLSSVGPEAATTYAKHQEQIDEMVALALPEDTGEQDAEVLYGEIADHPASAIGVTGEGGVEGALVLVRSASALHEAGEDRALTTLARLVTVALRNSHLQSEQRNFFTHVTNLLVSTLDAHLDFQTDHSRRVAQLANRIGRAMGLEEERLHGLHFASLLHDIGMLRIDKESLGISRIELEKHPASGFEMLTQIDLWRPVAPLVRHHHERYDGSGYPDGLSGEAIPLESRIIAVAEAYDSMTSTHSYRTALPPEQALDQIRLGSGSQFDPGVVKIMLELPRS